MRPGAQLDVLPLQLRQLRVPQTCLYCYLQQNSVASSKPV